MGEVSALVFPRCIVLFRFGYWHHCAPIGTLFFLVVYFSLLTASKNKNIAIIIVNIGIQNNSHLRLRLNASLVVRILIIISHANPQTNSNAAIMNKALVFVFIKLCHVTFSYSSRGYKSPFKFCNDVAQVFSTIPISCLVS